MADFGPGLGEIFLGMVILVSGFELAICSKWDRSEDTGFCQSI